MVNHEQTFIQLCATYDRLSKEITEAIEAIDVQRFTEAAVYRHNILLRLEELTYSTAIHATVEGDRDDVDSQ